MATEKATDTTATQNPARKSPKAPAKSIARPQTSMAAPNAASTPTPATPAATSKSPRARAKKSKPSQAPELSAEVLGESGAALERALLAKESSKSLAQAGGTTKPACKAHCGQCGREMRFVPFSLSNLMCRSCYGLDRYRRPTAPTLPALASPRSHGSR